MRKCLVVVLIGMVLAIDVYGLVNEFISELEAKKVEESYTIVYME